MYLYSQGPNACITHFDVQPIPSPHAYLVETLAPSQREVGGEETEGDSKILGNHRGPLNHRPSYCLEDASDDPPSCQQITSAISCNWQIKDRRTSCRCCTRWRENPTMTSSLFRSAVLVFLIAIVFAAPTSPVRGNSEKPISAGGGKERYVTVEGTCMASGACRMKPPFDKRKPCKVRACKGSPNKQCFCSVEDPTAVQLQLKVQGTCMASGVCVMTTWPFDKRSPCIDRKVCVGNINAECFCPVDVRGRLATG